MRLSAFHPLTALVYFAAVLAVTMFCFSPAVGICSAVGAFLFCAITQSCRQTASDLAFYIFLTAVLTVTNPLFSHKGVTPLFFVNGKAYTKEALFYGLTAGLSLTAVIMWCKALGKVLTREKLLYIFGRKTPKAALDNNDNGLYPKAQKASQTAFGRFELLWCEHLRQPF